MGLFNSEKERANKIKWPQWDSGAPMPQVFCDGHKTFLIYMLSEVDPDWDGTSVNMIDAGSDEVYPLALVEFDGGTSRFGIANVDVHGGLPVANKGMEWYSAHIIENSNWIEEIKKIHKVHPEFDEDRWHDLKHYLLLFHDELFEVIAKGYQIEIFNTSFRKLSEEVLNRMNK